MDASGTATNRTFEDALDALRKIILGNNLATTPLASDAVGRDTFYTNLYALEQSAPFLNLKGLAIITPLAGMAAANIAAMAPNDIAVRYALHALNPFALAGADYGQHNVNGVLDLVDYAAHTGEMTGQYLADRAAFLERKIWFSTQDKNPVDPDYQYGSTANEFQNDNTYFEDAASGYKIAQGFSPATPFPNIRRYYFGGAGNDTYTGGSVEDHLFGGAGNDVLSGGDGSDYLEGGKGGDTLQGGADTDTYAYKTDDGFDTIIDSDGNGSIVVDGNTLAAGDQSGSRVYKGMDAGGKEHTYVFLNGDKTTGGDLLIDNTLLVRNYNPSAGNGMGLTLGDAAQAPSPTLSGDLAPLDQNPGATGIQLGYDALNNLLADPNTPAPGYQDKLYGGAGNDILEGRGGIDILCGVGGNDTLYAGDQVSVAQAIANGDSDPDANAQGDWLNGGSGSDTLTSGAGDDILMGGGGQDLIIAGAGGDHIMGDGDYSTQAPVWSIAQTGPLTAQIVAIGLDPSAYTTLDGSSDVIYAGRGNDFVVGGLGNDIIFGGAGNDTLWGDDANIPQGNDFLEGGKDDDNLIGGGGNDLYAYNSGDGNDKIYDTLTDTNILLFGAGIAPDDLKLSVQDTGYVLTLNDGSTIRLMSGAAGFVNEYQSLTFDPQHTDIGQLQFADGSSISWAEFLQRGLVQHGTPNSIVLGSNYNDELSGANCTLIGGAGSDTYSYQAGDGIVRIKDAVIAGDTNTLKFGAGITAGQIRLGLGSLKLDLGPSAGSGQARDEIHLDGFNPDDAFNTSTIQRFEFDGGSTLTTAELLARGFDLDGTAGNDTIGGTGRPHQRLGRGRYADRRGTLEPTCSRRWRETICGSR